MRLVLAGFVWCGTPTKELQAAKRCGCSPDEERCFIQLKDVAAGLEGQESARRLCFREGTNLPDHTRLSEAVERLLGYPVVTTNAVVVPRHGKKLRSPIYGFKAAELHQAVTAQAAGATAQVVLTTYYWLVTSNYLLCSTVLHSVPSLCSLTTFLHSVFYFPLLSRLSYHFP